nr:hypothetical protein [Tanacetum cinerariifolium]
MNGNWNKRHVDNSVFSNNKWKESNYGNPPNIATDTFFKAYEEGNELIQMKHKEDNKSDEQSNKKQQYNSILPNNQKITISLLQEED